MYSVETRELIMSNIGNNDPTSAASVTQSITMHDSNRELNVNDGG